MAKKHSRKKIKSELTRIVEYLVTGGAWFWSGYAVFAICDKWLMLSLWWSKLIANVVGLTINFALQRYWVFSGRSKKEDFSKVSGKYIALTGVNFVIDYYIVFGLTKINITPYIGQFVSAGFFTFWNYLWYKFWVFAGKRQPVKRPRPAGRKVKRVVKHTARAVTKRKLRHV